MISFIRQRRIIKRLIIVTGLLSAVFVYQCLFRIISGETLNFSNAYQNIKFQQSINEFNPIENAAKTTGVTETIVSVSQNENFRIIAPVEEVSDDDQAKKIVVSPVETFMGRTLFPNSDVFLEIHSKKVSVLTKSDGAGNWSWNNSGKPLEEGEHTIEAYNISPYELSGKRDIFTQKFSFSVDSKIEKSDEIIELEANKKYKEIDGDEDLGDKFTEGEIKGLYFFDAVIPNKKEYSPGGVVDTQLIFSELGSRERQESDAKYEVFAYIDGVISKTPVATFAEKLDTKNFDSFFKKITLKRKIQSGNYLILVTVVGGGEEYVQSVDFKVRDEAIIVIGNNVVTKTRFLSVLIWNILFVLLFIIWLLLVTIYEYKRMMVVTPIDEDYLKKKGYF